MKKTIVVFSAMLVLAVGIFLFLNNPQNTDQEQAVLGQTMYISKEYISLRYRTDNILINAEQYSDYETWSNEMTVIIKGWESLEKNASHLGTSAEELTQEKISLKFAKPAIAYTKQEISNIIDKAPLGKKIITLAKHLGVDAKRAQLILNQDQAQVTRDAWGEAGDAFQTLENEATVIKDGCKVAGFVGTIALSGGTSALAAGSVLTKTAVLVSGADLVLEVTDDGAKIALGNNNKISVIVGDVRKVTEPAAAILMITDLPKNLTKGIEKLNAVAFGADQLNSAIQSGAVIGIKLIPHTQNTSSQAMQVSVLEKEEVQEWLTEQNASENTETKEEIEKALEINEKESEHKQVTQSNTEETKQTGKEIKTDSPQTNKERIPIAEFNNLDDNEGLKNITLVKRAFGEPDFSTTNKGGRTVYVYLDRIKYESDNSGSVRFTFYTLEDYKKIAESAFGWNEDYQEIWDASGGGIKASTEIRDTDFFKSTYGI